MGETRLRRTGGRSARVGRVVRAAAVEELLAHGIDGLSVARVARRAGVHETTIYRRWPGKARLAIDAVTNATQASICDPCAGTLRDDLVDVLRQIVAFVRTPTGGLLLQLAMRRDLPEYEAARDYLRVERFAAGMEILARASRRGELRPGVDHRLAMESLIGPVHVRLLLTGGPLDDAFIANVVDLFLSGAATGSGAIDAGASAVGALDAGVIGSRAIDVGAAEAGVADAGTAS